MATKLPSQEEFENWTAFQVADLLRQFGMPESAVVVEKLGMNGSRFLVMPYKKMRKNKYYFKVLQKASGHAVQNVSDYELSRFKIMHQLNNIEEFSL